MLLTHTCSRCKKDYEAEGVPSAQDICPDCWIGDNPEFGEFKKIPRLSRDMIVTEKIDGTNGLICITDTGLIFAGSRNRWLWNSTQAEIYNDNFGFARWVKEHKEELMKLGPGFHYGEWMGQGIQRTYGLKEKRFYLFNSARWVKQMSTDEPILEEKQEYCPQCCHVVPILYKGMFDTNAIEETIDDLLVGGSKAIPGFMKPEGIVIYHSAARQYFKKTIEKDESPKGVSDGSQSG